MIVAWGEEAGSIVARWALCSFCVYKEILEAAK